MTKAKKIVVAWQEDAESKTYPKLNGDLDVDVAVIGGGLAGITTAYLLNKKGHRVAVLEAEEIGNGATFMTTAFITQIIDTNLTDLVEMYGTANAKLVWQSGATAIAEVANIVKTEKIDCGFQYCSAFVYASEESQIEGIEADAKAALKMGFGVKLKKDNKLGFPNHGYMELAKQAKFQPLQYLYGLAERAQEQGVKIFTKTSAVDILGRGPFKIKTPDGEVRAKKVVVTTYDPFNKPKEVFAKKGMYVSYVLELTLPRGIFKEGIYFDQSNPYNYFRIDRYPEYDRMILGGADHRSELPVNKNKSFKALEKYLKVIVDDLPYSIVRHWTGPILEPSDGVALIGEYKPDRYLATAFSGNGMTYSHIAALLLTDLISGKKNKWADLYDPKRRRKPSRYFKKGIDYTQELIGGAIKNTIKAGKK